MRLMAQLSVLVLFACLPACGQEVQGELRLTVVPLHSGRNPVQDPFSLVAQVEIGLTDEDGRFTSMGSENPLSRFSPGLVEPGRVGSPTLIGLNDRGRPVSRGFGRVIGLLDGVDETVPVHFARVDSAVARRVRAIDRALADPFAARPPSLRLDLSNLEQGQVESESDGSCVVWILWDDDQLLFKVRVFDESIEATEAPTPVAQGDSLGIYLDAAPLGGQAGPEDRVLRLGADGRVEPADGVQDLSVEQVSGGYVQRFALPWPSVAKNQEFGFDLRLVDVDEGASPSLMTWVFDPIQAGEDPLPDQYGRLTMGVPVLDALDRTGSSLGFSSHDGQVTLGGHWDAQGLVLELDVHDDQVTPAGPSGGLDGADRVAVWLDLANGDPPALDPIRFFRLSASAGGTTLLEGGPDPANVTDQGLGFSGSVSATTRASGYTLAVTLPWADLQLASEPQRGWFLGLEIEVVDVDGADEQTSCWSDAPDRPDRWSEIRLFSAE